MDQEQVDQLVANGVTLLDEHFSGRHWVDQVNWDNLDIDCSGLCILGHLFGTYSNGRHELGLTVHEGGWDFGFMTGDGVTQEAVERSWRRFAD